MAPSLDSAALAEAARELEGKLFDGDGDWARNLTADDAQKLFVLLRSAGSTPTS